MKWWENQFLHVREGRLQIGSREAAAWAARCGTPLFIYSRRQILANFERLVSMLPRIPNLRTRICYAMKANPHEKILGQLKRAGAWIDAVSPGEVDASLAAGFPAERIIFTGTSLGRQDLARVFAVAGRALRRRLLPEHGFSFQPQTHPSRGGHRLSRSGKTAKEAINSLARSCRKHASTPPSSPSGIRWKLTIPLPR